MYYNSEAQSYGHDKWYKFKLFYPRLALGRGYLLCKNMYNISSNAIGKNIHFYIYTENDAKIYLN